MPTTKSTIAEVNLVDTCEATAISLERKIRKRSLSVTTTTATNVRLLLKTTLKHRERVASLRFHFNSQNEVERVTTERYRQEDDDYAPWTGYFSTYEKQQRMRIPTDAKVQWNLSDGDLSYWRASIEDIDYQSAITSKS